MKTITKDHATLVTPQQAAEWLKSNKGNRSLRGVVMKAYSRDMRNGRWQLNGEPIVLTVDGRVLNGQHRLEACVESGRPFLTFVYICDDPDGEIHATIDTGIARTAGDEFSWRGYKNSTTLAAACRLQAQKDAAPSSVGMNAKYTTQELADVLAAHPGLSDAVSDMTLRPNLKSLITPTITAFVFYNAAMASPTKAQEFVDRLEDGAGVGSDSPILLLRDRLLISKSRRGVGRLDRRTMIALMIKAWNKFFIGEPVGVLKWGHKEDFPLFIESADDRKAA